MKIKFLGTGAADWGRQKEEGKEHRRLSSALVDDVLLIDPGPWVFDAFDEYEIDYKKIKYIINTHRHSDHFNEETLNRLLSVGAEFHDLSVGEVKSFGNYEVSCYKANHPTCENSRHFIISDGKSNLFYGLDSAWLLYDEVEAIKKKGIDFAVIDATIGFTEGDYRIFEHNNLRMVIEMKLTLEPYIKRLCISHMARTLHTSHNELQNAMKNHNIEVAYDGLETEF